MHKHVWMVRGIMDPIYDTRVAEVVYCECGAMELRPVLMGIKLMDPENDRLAELVDDYQWELLLDAIDSGKLTEEDKIRGAKVYDDCYAEKPGANEALDEFCEMLLEKYVKNGGE